MEMLGNNTVLIIQENGAWGRFLSFINPLFWPTIHFCFHFHSSSQDPDFRALSWSKGHMYKFFSAFLTIKENQVCLMHMKQNFILLSLLFLMCKIYSCIWSMFPVKWNRAHAVDTCGFAFVISLSFVNILWGWCHVKWIYVTSYKGIRKVERYR